MDTAGWLFWALLSALFAALTAIFAKIGIQNVDSDLATLIRTFVLIVPLALFVWLAGKWTNPFTLSYENTRVSRPLRTRDGRFVAVLLPRAADSARPRKSRRSTN